LAKCRLLALPKFAALGLRIFIRTTEQAGKA
jgi:hypothetical protein